MDFSLDDLSGELDAGYGFRVPRALALAIAATRDVSRADLWTAFSLEWVFQSGQPWTKRRSIDPGYAGFVPEFFAFAQPGVDGILYGYVVHAPELERDDLPVFEFIPEYPVLQFYAADIETALLAWAGSNAETNAQNGPGGSLETYTAVARALGLPATPPPPRPERGLTPFVPPIPDGWRYVATEDRIGVLAPAESFGRAEIAVDRFFATYGEFDQGYDGWLPRRGADAPAGADTSLRSLLDDCRNTMQAGFAGSALVGIRRLITAAEMAATDPDTMKLALFETWADVYDALGRPLLANVVREVLAVQRYRDEGSRRWVTSWGRYLVLPIDLQRRVDEIAGPRGPNLTLSYKYRFADAMDRVERDNVFN